MIQRRDKEDNPFSRMQQEALQQLQALSGKLWTDFNAHDPGVTILEAAHYALLELDYRLRFPVEAYLTEKGNIDFDRLGLLSRQTFEEQSTVTTADYEKLLCKQIHGVEQCRVWLDPNRRYRIEIIAKEANHEQIQRDVQHIYHAHRNLGENLGEIVFTDKLTPAGTPAAKDETPQFARGEKQSEDTAPAFSTAYYSLQHIFPDSYGINEKGLPAGSSHLRKMQARQLKAYLLVFDFLLANTLHQAGNTPVVLTPDSKLPPEYKQNFSIGDMESLLDEAERHKRPLQDTDFLHTQKSLLLDRLDALYGEDSRRLFAGEKSLPRANQKRADLLRRLPELNKNRFRAGNPAEGSRSGFEEFYAALTGNRDATPATNVFSAYNLRVVSDDEFFSRHPNLNMEYIYHYFREREQAYGEEDIPAMETELDSRSFLFLEQNLTFFWHNLLFENLLTQGTEPENYRIVKAFDKGYHILVFHHRDTDRWINMGYAFEREKLAYTANLLWKFLAMLRERSSVCYLLEHALLGEDEEHAHRLSLVFPAWGLYLNSESRRRQLFNERLPAHLHIRALPLNAADLYEFEHDYFAWKHALQQGNEEQKKLFTEKLHKLI